jgi:DNA-binding MurR/RpiR family transcriptional regulator
MKIDTAVAQAGPSLSVGNLTVRLREQMAGLPDAAAAIARQILDDPAGVTTCSIGELARLARTSPASVTRLCRAFGLSGYPDLKLAIAAELGQASATAWDRDLGASIGPDDRPERVGAIVAAASLRTLQRAAEVLDHAALERAAVAIAAAGRCALFGVGGSYLVAAEAQMRLHRIGLPVWAFNAQQDAKLSAALSRKGDVFFAISRSGRTHEVIDATGEARARGATTICLTSFATAPLAKLCDIVLTIPAQDISAGHAGLSVKYAQLLVVDCLYSLVARHSYGPALDALAQTARALAPHRTVTGARRAAKPRTENPR